MASRRSEERHTYRGVPEIFVPLVFVKRREDLAD